MKSLLLYLVTWLTVDAKLIAVPPEDIYPPLTLVAQHTTSAYSMCHKQLKIFDSGGNFVKTVCYANIEATFDEATSFCGENGMKLYKFDSLDSYNGWLQLTNSIWPPSSRAAVWVNGQRRRICSGKFRIVESSHRTLIHGDIHFTDLHNSYGPFAASPVNCLERMHFFCERTSIE
jgi:hypothetical protein